MDEDLKLYIPLGVKPEAETVYWLWEKTAFSIHCGVPGDGRHSGAWPGSLPGM